MEVLSGQQHVTTCSCRVTASLQPCWLPGPSSYTGPGHLVPESGKAPFCFCLTICFSCYSCAVLGVQSSPFVFGGARGAWAEAPSVREAHSFPGRRPSPANPLRSLCALPLSRLPRILNWGAFRPCWSLFCKVMEYGCMRFLELSCGYYYDFKNLTEYSGSVSIPAFHSNVAGVLRLESLRLPAIVIFFAPVREQN